MILVGPIACCYDCFGVDSEMQKQDEVSKKSDDRNVMGIMFARNLSHEFPHLRALQYFKGVFGSPLFLLLSYPENLVLLECFEDSRPWCLTLIQSTCCISTFTRTSSALVFNKHSHNFESIQFADIILHFDLQNQQRFPNLLKSRSYLQTSTIAGKKPTHDSL